MKNSVKKIRPNIEEGSGNIFADLGLSNPDELLMKADLSLEIHKSIRRKKLTQVQAAKLLGIDQPKVSAIVRGDLDRFSTDRLLRFLRILGNDIDIVVKPKTRSRKTGKLQVTALSSLGEL